MGEASRSPRSGLRAVPAVGFNRWTIFLLIGLACGRGRAATPADFATTVLAWNGTNGVSGYNTHPEYTLGPPSTVSTPDVPDNTSVFSFGWGGSLTLGFTRPITNDPRHPGGYDFIVFGNSFYAGDDNTAPYRKPGYVEVGVDPTGHHSYGDGSQVVWYWLKGTPAPATLAGFPIPVPAYSDTVIGYANCTPTDGTGDPLIPSDPTVPGITPGTAGGDAFDLDWAVDANGNPITPKLQSVDFVRITCAVNAYDRASLSQYATAVDAVALVRPRITGDVDMDNAVTLADATLVLRAVDGLDSLTPEQTLRADTTGHGGDPTTADAANILRLAAGL